MREPQFEPGTILADKYRLDSRLGEGGMGTVYQATHLLLKAPVAIKVIDREVSEGDVAFTRFMREAQAAASLRSPHVVQVLDYGMEKGRPYMVMELLEGESLADRIDRLGTLTAQETYRVLSHVARAMSKAHEAGIIHRDLKPDNVFLVHNEGDELAKVLDFGVAKVEATSLGEGRHTRTGSLLGTPYYMSPEQAQGNKEVDHRSDLWALGVIAFECLAGKRPFSSDGLGELVLQICIRDIPRPSDFAPVPPGFDDWFARATERDVGARFQSAREMMDALGVALGLQKELSLGGEGPWSTAAALPQSVSQPHTRPAEDATTERDLDPSSPVSSRLAPSASPPRVEDRRSRAASGSSPRAAETPIPTRVHRTEGQGGARWEESVEPPDADADELEPSQDSQWEIVPHGEPALAAPPRRNLALEMALAEEKRKPTTVLLIGLLFIMLGAAAVLLVRGFVGFDEHGVVQFNPGAFRSLPKNSAPRVSPGKTQTPERQPNRSAGEDHGDAASTTPLRRSGPLSGGSPATGDGEREGEALDAIDASAEQQVQGSSTEPSPSALAPHGSAKDGSSKDGGSKEPPPKDGAKKDAPKDGSPPAGDTAAPGSEPSPPAASPAKDPKVPPDQDPPPPAGPRPEVPTELAPPPPPAPVP